MSKNQNSNGENRDLDSSDEEKETAVEEIDDGRRDKIFSKFFLRSLSN
jgi:hypothetical protein